MYFNWGNGSTGDQDARLKLEQEMLLEQARAAQAMKGRAAGGGYRFGPRLGAFSFPVMERYDTGDAGTNTTLDLKLSVDSQNLFTYLTYPTGFTLNAPNGQHPPATMEPDDFIEYATFAYNYDDKLIYYVYYNSDSDELEFRSLDPMSGESVYIDSLTGGFVQIRELLYIGGGEFIFVDPSDNYIITVDTTGSITDVIISPVTSQFNGIFTYNGKYYVTHSDFDIESSEVSEIDIATGTISSSNVIYFNDSLNQVEPFASIDPIGDPSPDLKVVDVISVASTDEIPGYGGARKVYANIMIWDDDTSLDFSSANTWFVFAELDPDTGEATYIGDGSGAYDLFYYNRQK